jgi:hypothetical protein
MRFRKLRIAWSVTCGIACVLLVVLWIRSYWRFDVIERASSKSYSELRSNSGTVYISYSSPPLLPPPLGRDPAWMLTLYPASPQLHPILAAESPIRFPYLCPVLLFGFIATAPWIRHFPWRFSLRTLLIVTTLVAVVLGMAVYFLRTH